jgi:hypothetical protein
MVWTSFTLKRLTTGTKLCSCKVYLLQRIINDERVACFSVMKYIPWRTYLGDELRRVVHQLRRQHKDEKFVECGLSEL